MHINVAQLLKEPIGSKRIYNIDEFIGKKDENHIQGTFTLTHTNRSILVQGTLTATATGYCNRCLEPVDFPISFTMEDEYLPSIDITSGARLPETQDAFIINENHVLNLEDAFNQYIVTATPMKVLCRDDCAGLCSICGRNQNHDSCSCLSTIKDHRWSKLTTQGKRKEY